MRMFNVLPRLIKNTVKNLTHFTCNSPIYRPVPEKNFPYLIWIQQRIYTIVIILQKYPHYRSTGIQSSCTDTKMFNGRFRMYRMRILADRRSHILCCTDV